VKRTTAVVEINGRERIRRRGIYFTVIAGRRRMVYQQLNGEIELADLCTCFFDWTPDFEVTRSPGCVIDQHRLEAAQQWDESA
jgi:hypothetical protein